MSSAKKILLAAAGLLLASAAVCGVQAWRERSVGPVGRPVLSGPIYVPVAVDAPAVKAEVWDAPAPLARGREWVYDVFTPPEIFYSPRTRQFAVKPPPGVGDDTPELPFGVELVAVKRDPFRLQLIGYVGEDADARGVFENRMSGEIFLAAAGRRVPNLALTVKAFGVRREGIALPESMTVNQRVATAVIHDEQSRQDVTLTQRERHFSGNMFALVASTGETATREVRVGDVFKIGDANYRIEKIVLDPAAIEITKTAPTLELPERRTLPVRFDPTESPASSSP